MSQDETDIWHMKSALNLARQGLGRVSPNPSVGCVIVKDGIVLGRARTADGGRPHAETIALKQAGTAAKGATAYVTLEPCAHIGETGSCATALIEAGLRRVVIACLDNDARVDGQGVEMLQNAGIDVTIGVLEKEALALNAGFFLKNSQNRPLITLKTASTLDAKIAAPNGESKWITGEAARRFAHIERAQHDAILVGVNTVLTDKPSLSTRVNGVVHDPFIIILDTHLKLRENLQALDNMRKNKLLIVTTESASIAPDIGATIIAVPKNDEGRIDLCVAMATLAEKGVTRLLVEGGAKVVTSFLNEELFDRVLWFKNASILGASSYSAFQETGVSSLNQSIKLDHQYRRILGQDTLDIFNKKHSHAAT